MLWILAAALAAAPAVSAETAVSRSSSSAQALLAESGVRTAQGDLRGALAAAVEAVKAAPGDARAHLQVAVSQLRLGDFAAAEAEATRAIELGYRQAGSYNVRSAAESHEARFEPALADAERAVAANPDGAIGYLNRAAAKAGLSRPGGEILSDFERAAQLDARYAPQYAAARKRWASSEAPVLAPKALEAPAAAAAASARVPVHAAARAPSAAAPAPAPSETRPSAPPARGPLGLGAAALALCAALILWLGRRGWRTHRLRQVRFGSLIASPPAGDELPAGSVVAGLYIVGRLAERRGGVETYEARDLDDRPRVLKRAALRPGSGHDAPARARRAASLRLAGVELIETVFEHDRALCVCCEPLPGVPLSKLRERLEGGLWQPEQALTPLQTACEALDEAHRLGVIHGALGPSSIWVERGRAALADFAFGPSLGLDAALLAPEGEPGPAADLYGLARSFRDLLAREDGDLPPALREVFRRALEPDPARRYRSAAELFGAFRSAVVPLVQ